MTITGIANHTDTAGMINHAGRSGRAAGDFGRAVIQRSMKGGHEITLSKDALISYANPQTGESAGIYRADEYSKDNPVYIIKGRDADGNEFEKKIDAGAVDPNHCSYHEMMVLNMETGRTSPDDYLRAVITRDKAGVKSLAEKTDYIACARAVMNDYKALGNWNLYLAMDKWIQGLTDYAGKNAVRAQQPRKESYAQYRTENYRIVPDNEAGCFTIYDRNGGRLGVFSYSDMKLKRDEATGKQFLISEHGSMSYSALVPDGELKDALAHVMGKEHLEEEKLQGFQVKTHAGTGIQVLIRDTEAGRGGTVLLQTDADKRKYEALAQEYYDRYPNLVRDKNAAYIRADLEIRGLMERTGSGIISIGWDAAAYDDNSDSGKKWALWYSEGGYESLYEWFHQGIHKEEDLQNISSWIRVLDCSGIRSRYIAL